MTTTSESLFEDICRSAGLRFERVPTADGQQSPDYVVWFGCQRVIAEIKQFDPNQREEDDAEARARGEVFVQGPKLPGDRVRSAINKAAPQLKAHAPPGGSSAVARRPCRFPWQPLGCQLDGQGRSPAAGPEARSPGSSD